MCELRCRLSLVVGRRHRERGWAGGGGAVWRCGRLFFGEVGLMEGEEMCGGRGLLEGRRRSLVVCDCGGLGWEEAIGCCGVSGIEVSKCPAA